MNRADRSTGGCAPGSRGLPQRPRAGKVKCRLFQWPAAESRPRDPESMKRAEGLSPARSVPCLSESFRCSIPFHPGLPHLPDVPEQVQPRVCPLPASRGRYCGRSAESSSPRASLQRSLIMKFFRPASRTFLLRTVKHMGQRYTIASAPLAFASSTFFTRKGS